MTLATALAMAALGCGRDDPETKRAHGFRHVELAVSDELDAEVTRHAREARALGLLPIVHVRTPWNFSQTLQRSLDDPQVTRALEGIYLIEIAYETRCLEDTCKARWASPDVLCFNYGQTFHAIGPDGERAGPSASPSKDGPRDAAQNAAMIREYRALQEKAGAPAQGCQPLFVWRQ